MGALEAFGIVPRNYLFLRSIICAGPDMECLHYLFCDIFAELWMNARENLFQQGSLAPAMMFVLSGEVAYGSRPEDDSETAPAWNNPIGFGKWKATELIEKQDHFCEHALWVDWRHVGDAIISFKSQLVLLKGAKFKEFMMEWPSAETYARRYAELVNEQGDDMTDLKFPDRKIREITKDAHGDIPTTADYDREMKLALEWTLNLSPKLLAFQKLDQSPKITASKSVRMFARTIRTISDPTNSKWTKSMSSSCGPSIQQSPWPSEQGSRGSCGGGEPAANPASFSAI